MPSTRSFRRTKSKSRFSKFSKPKFKKFRERPDMMTNNLREARTKEKKAEKAPARARVVLAPLFPERSSQEKAATAQRIKETFGFAPLCPKCNIRMMLRTARRGPTEGRKFWSCSRYQWEESPCSGTRPYAAAA